MGQGKRGMAFEKLINLSNEMYQREGVALINKRPTPVKVLKMVYGRVKDGYYESKSTVDYDGVYRGRAIAFEAKSTNEINRFDLKTLRSTNWITWRKQRKWGQFVSSLLDLPRVSQHSQYHYQSFNLT